MQGIAARRLRRALTVSAATALGLCAPAAAAGAASFSVDDRGDFAQSASELTSCVSTNNTCTLRAAVQAADNAAGPSTITLPPGEYKLTIGSTGANDPSTGDLDIKNNAVTIRGSGPGSTTVDANQIDRAFAVQSGASLTLEGMTIENGVPSAVSTAPQDGGAVYAAATTRLSATGVSLVASHAQSGGAVYATNGAQLSLTNVTISGDTAVRGGGLDFAGTSPTSLVNDTIAFNSGGGVFHASGASTRSGVLNTIVAENSGGDCADAAVSPAFSLAADAGHNLDGDSSCFQGDAPTDKLGVNPLLERPADNGGPALTDALEAGSPAIDGGTDNLCPSSDARGVPRPQGASCDIGAYESQAASLSLTASAPATASTGVPFDVTLTASGGGPGPSTGTTVSDQLPAGAILYGVTPSQGSCTTSGSPPVKVTCALGRLDSGAGATVTLVVAIPQAGSVTDSASTGNDEGSSASAQATTLVQAPVAPAGATAPTATTGGATAILPHTATLGGTIAPGGQPTSYFFQVGTSTKYSMITPVAQVGVTPASVAATVSGLDGATLYHYRLVATNDSGTSYGADMTFRTVGRLKPMGLGIRVAHGGGTAPPFRLRFAGKLSLPRRTGPALACSGRLTVVVLHGRTLLGHRVALSRSCTYTSVFSFKRVGGSRTLLVHALFLGNMVLTSATSRTITVRLG